MSSLRHEPEDLEDFRIIPLGLLRHNERLKFPIRSEDGVLLLSEGSVMTPRNIEALEHRGICKILVHRSEPAAELPLEALGSADSAHPPTKGERVGLHTAATRRLDQMSSSLFPLRPTTQPFRDELAPTGLRPYDEAMRRELWRRHETFVTEFREGLRALAIRQKSDALQTQSILHAYFDMVVPDVDLFTCFAASPHHSHYPFRHSLHVAMLSIALGLRAGFDRRHLTTLGTAALLHDMGMLRVPRALWSKTAPLTPDERHAIMEHPIHTINAIEECGEIEDDVRLICYQVHERPNGLGYPRLRRSEQIHPFARIVAVADMYISLVSERPYRPALMPYKAIETMLRLVRAGWLESTPVRLLLETLALYPVGSYVVLNDSRLAKVLRANGERYNQPIVHVWPPNVEPTDGAGELIDLREHPQLVVSQAIPAPPLD